MNDNQKNECCFKTIERLFMEIDALLYVFEANADLKKAFEELKVKHIGKSKNDAKTKAFTRKRYLIFARRTNKEKWTDWTAVRSIYRAYLVMIKINDAGFLGKIYDSREKRVLKEDD